MKKTLIFIILSIILFQPGIFARSLTTQLSGEEFYNDVVNELVTGKISFSPKNIFAYIVDILMQEINSSKSLLICILVIALISGVFNVVKQENNSAGNVAFFTCYCLMTIVAAKLVSVSVGYGNDVIKEMSVFITKLAPLLSLILAAGGYTSSAAIFYPTFSTAVYIITIIIERCIVPLIYISCVMGIVNNISGKTQLNNFNSIIKSLSKWILTAILTVFSGINAIYGFCMPTIDTLGMKATKFAVGSIVPVVGGFLSESIETVIGSTRLMKNAVGTAGIICMIVMCAVPVIKTAAIMIMLKISAALIEPISDKRFSDMLMEVADAVTMVFAMLIITAVLFIISVAIVISTTNVTM